MAHLEHLPRARRVRGIHPLHRNPRLCASRPAQRRNVPPALSKGAAEAWAAITFPMPTRGRLATFALLSSTAAAHSPEPWTLARSDRFEVYSDAGANTAQSLLSAFERMRVFFDRQAGMAPAHHPVRIICFAARQEYN